ncbi:MAG TPA: phosphatase [Candidatus Latescibacteria bacterium]|nr:phosphatase [Candidatus Latescibacterota bacterium]
MLTMFRQVSLPCEVLGRLFLHSMPGRNEPFEDAQEEIERQGITRVVCLTPREEIRSKSPSYYSALESDSLPWTHTEFPIPNYGVPQDEEAFLNLIRSIAHHLRKGERVLIHCGAGYGRTGMVAICVLMALGLGKDEAEERVKSANSSPETQEQ